jgi:rhodanese-related sulfurtransferase
MSPEAFAKDHIPGSVSFTLENSPISRLFKKKAFRQFLGPNKDRPLVFYSFRPPCANCHSAALLAVRLGYRQVFRYPDGVVGWMRSGRAAAGTMHDEIQP